MSDAEWVDAVHTRLLELYRDPVDEYEDQLATRMGAYRHPALVYKAWRRIRVRAIDAREDAGDEPVFGPPYDGGRG